MFSQEIYRKAEQFKKQNRLQEIEEVLDEHKKHFIFKTTLSKELDGCQDTKKLFGYNAIQFIQLLLYRSKSLIEGSIITLNNNRILSSIISVRAHFETTGSIGYLLKRLSSYYSGNIDFDRIDDDLLRLSLGATTIENPKVPNPINTLNLIDAVDDLIRKRLFKSKEPHDKPFRELYEDLCDFCHPNFQGIKSGSDIIDAERAVIYHETDRIDRMGFTFFFHLNMSTTLFMFFYKEILTLLKKKEIMPIFHRRKEF